jgi:Thioredoxin-like
MVTKRLTMRAVAGLSMWVGFGAAAQAQLPPVTPEGAFKIMPRQPGVNITTPTPDQVPNCKVETIPDPKTKQPMAFVVRDPAGKPVRQFVSYDNKTFNILVFYVNGEEAYREVYPPQTTEPYQFRWLGPNGTKWGLDKDRDGKVDEWVVISPEELSQELLQAVLTKDTKRAEALILTKANLDTIGLGGAKAQELLGRAAEAVKRTIAVGGDLKASPEAKWDHLQLGAPQATSADFLSSRDDLIVHKNGTILVQDGKESKFLQTGEMVQIGRVWKLIDGPSVGGGGGGPMVPDSIRPLLDQLNELDKTGPDQPYTTATIAALSAKKAQILEQIVAKLAPAEQETWTKLLVDSLSSAAEGEKLDGKYLARLKQLKEAFSKGANANLAAYATFRFLLTENSVAQTNIQPGELAKLQELWRTNLDGFIKTYPNADDTAEAMLRLAMAFEFLGTKDGEEKAKEWYQQLSRKTEKNPHATKAAGAIRRLESEGKPLELTGPTLAGGPQFNADGLRDKVVVVYYCASWSRTLADDVNRLKALEKQYGPKGMALVTVCLDNDANTANKTMAAAGLPGHQLFAPGGLDASPFAAHYGIIVVPHMFVAGKDGKIVNRSAQVATLEDDLKKLMP